MDWFLLIIFIICLIFFSFYFININLFNLLPYSFIRDFKNIATKNNPLTQHNKYTIHYINNNFIITDSGVLYIDTQTSLLNINFAFSSYTFDIVKDFSKIVPIIKILNK